ncbi:hypothetical protein TNCV_4316371 [Trichonephila clavipes]|nr:hypothetical protein TNCV_4316371 [Trichonephila clavipes]
MSTSCTQWLPMPSLSVMGLYDDIERKQATCILLEVFRYGYVYYDVACKTGAHLKKQCGPPVSIYVVSSTTAEVRLYAAMLKEAVIMIIVLV